MISIPAAFKMTPYERIHNMRVHTLSLIAAVSLVAAAWAGQVVTVMHKTASIRADKQFFAPTIATAAYGAQLAVIEERGGWYKVSAGGTTGWIHGSATAKGAVAVSAKTFDKGAASGEDVALAGKGFNEQVEGKYKKDHPEMNFPAVDRMEKIKVEDAALGKFAADGKLKSGGAN